MKRAFRLRSRKVFAQVLRQGRTLGSRHVVVFWLRDGGDGGQRLEIGFAVQRAVGSAVRRNRVRRRLRALAQVLAEELPAQGRMVWLGKVSALDAPWGELVDGTRRMLRRLRAERDPQDRGAG
ncbi:MAG: ribonuclease P protein component [Firmicutes bacterium]|nr:ribonuclease P protein component [Alicyclobacillaceae bacterium]MCL6496123.1 ribonuclease P protein component [Bacillota bacterium]